MGCATLLLLPASTGGAQSEKRNPLGKRRASQPLLLEKLRPSGREHVTVEQSVNPVGCKAQGKYCQCPE
jgi:hypothetical protein